MVSLHFFYIILHYQKLGYKGLQPSRKMKECAFEFKLQVAKMYLTTEILMSCCQSKRMGIAVGKVKKSNIVYKKEKAEEKYFKHLEEENLN